MRWNHDGRKCVGIVLYRIAVLFCLFSIRKSPTVFGVTKSVATLPVNKIAEITVGRVGKKQISGQCSLKFNLK